MKIVLILITILIVIPVIVSCGSCNNSSEKTGNLILQKENNPTAIVQNLSVVTATIDNINFISETDFTIKATVLTAEQKSDKPSIAVKGNQYILLPNFRFGDDGVLIKNDINDALKSLGKLTKGQTFKAEISLDNNKKWYIQRLIED